MKSFNPILTLTLLLLSCSNSNTKFVNNFYNYDFSKFKNKSILVRGNDNKGGTIVFISELKDKSKICSASYCVVIDNKQGTIKSTSRNMLGSTCEIDTLLLKKLALNFLSLSINYLRVDSFNNVFIKTTYFEGKPDLIKTTDDKYIDNIKGENWKEVRKNWYEKSE